MSAEVAMAFREPMKPLDAEAARALTDRIKGHIESAWELLVEAHDRRAWKALGYSRWEDYMRREFSMSRSRSYQLLDQGRTIKAITEAGVSTLVDISEREARDIKPHLEGAAA